MAKEKTKSVVRFVRKSNDLVEAKYKFDIWETRVFTKMLMLIRPDDEDFKDYRIYLHEVIGDFDLKKNKEAYEWLKRGARKLMTKIIKVVRETDEGLMEFQTPIAVGVENPLNLVKGREEEMAFVDISFHPKMRPYLIELQSKFTSYDVRNILKLPSAYSIRIYELLKQYEKIGKRRFNLPELKEIIGVIEEVQEKGKRKMIDNYPLYGNFRQRVLLKSQKDLKKFTDIYFEFEPIKKGRKVTGVLFYIYSNKPSHKTATRKPKQITKAEPFEGELFDDFFPIVKEWGIVAKTFRKWLDYHDENKIRAAIQAVRNQLSAGKEIENPGGLFYHLLKQPTLFDPIEQKKNKQVAKKKASESNAEKKRKLEAMQKQLERERHEKELIIIETILEEFPEAREIALEKVKSGIMARYFDDSKSFEENCENQFFLSAFRGSVKKEFAPQFEEIEKEYEPKIRGVKGAIGRL